MNNQRDILQHATELFFKVVNDVLASAEQMQGTVIAAAAFGGFCLFVYKVIGYYKNFNNELWSKEHGLAVVLIVVSFIGLPIFGIIFVGIYGINNHVAAWQIGLTTPMLIESAYVAFTEKARAEQYQKTFTPEEPEA